VLVLVLVLAAVLPAPAAHAHDIGRLLEQGRRLPEVRRLAALHQELHAKVARYEALEAAAGRAWLDTVGAIRAAADAEAAVDAARERLEERIRAAFQLSPGGSLEALLGAATFADVVAISEYTARAIRLDERALRERVVAEAVLTAQRAKAEAARASLQRRQERLRALLAEIERAVGRATTLAEDAVAEDEARRAFEAQQRWVAEALGRTGSWDLGVIDYEQDQSHLLALLGPTGGQTCETPAGLVASGRTFSGYASWYGWEFGGQPTATGAIFDPRLFTAANRWLPFGTFLRVRHGERCAIVLVNDRGPYGRLERVIDLSQAAAEYLGVGVSWVDAEILLPATA
jgi:rare lipoprotein A (peptidoglycan hydrolase)